MRRPLRTLVAVCLLLLLVLVTPRAPTMPPPIISRSTSPQDWSGLRTRLDERAYRAAVWYAEASKPKPSIPTRARSGGGGSHRGYASAKECVSMVEHGGSYSRSDNPTHTGRYQFSYPTWVAFGGSPDTWETASPAEQDEVFERAWNSPGGPGNWLPYDRCG